MYFLVKINFMLSAFVCLPSLASFFFYGNNMHCGSNSSFIASQIQEHSGKKYPPVCQMLYC